MDCVRIREAITTMSSRWWIQKGGFLTDINSHRQEWHLLLPFERGGRVFTSVSSSQHWMAGGWNFGARFVWGRVVPTRGHATEVQNKPTRHDDRQHHSGSE